MDGWDGKTVAHGWDGMQIKCHSSPTTAVKKFGASVGLWGRSVIKLVYETLQCFVSVHQNIVAGNIWRGPRYQCVCMCVFFYVTCREVRRTDNYLSSSHANILRFFFLSLSLDIYISAYIYVVSEHMPPLQWQWGPRAISGRAEIEPCKHCSYRSEKDILKWFIFQQ